MSAPRPKAMAPMSRRKFVDGQNSWELGGVKMRIFEGYFGKSDKIDGNWVWCCKLARKLKMTK